MTTMEFLKKLTSCEGAVTVTQGVATFEDGDAFDIRSAFDQHYGPDIERFSLCHEGRNPGGFTAEASRTGDYRKATGESIYEEVRIGVFSGDSSVCLVDVFVGLSDKGEPRVLVSTDGNGDDHAISVFPMRPADCAVERWKD